VNAALRAREAGARSTEAPSAQGARSAPRGLPAFVEPLAVPVGPEPERAAPAPEPVEPEPSSGDAAPQEAPAEAQAAEAEAEEAVADAQPEGEGEDQAEGEGEGEGEGEEEEEEEGDEEQGEGEAEAEGQEEATAALEAEPGADEPAVPTPEDVGVQEPPPARLGGTHPRPVPPPPTLSAQEVASLRRRTRISPDEHHDRVRAALGRVGRTARRAQLDIVHVVEAAAADTRNDILDRADRIAGLVGGAVARVRSTLDGAVAAIDATATACEQRIGQRATEDLGAADAREEATLQGVEQIIATAGPEMLQAWVAVKEDVRRTAQPSADKIKNTPQAPGCDAAAAARTLGTALTRRTGPDDRQTYINEQIGLEVPAMGRNKARDLQTGAERRAEALVSEELLTQLALQFLQVLNPALVATETTGNENQQEQVSEAGQTRLVLGSARDQALAVIRSSRDRARQTLTQTRDQLVDGLHRAGRLARRALTGQAEAGRRGLLASAGPFADAYREQVTRLQAAMPRGTLLDATVHVPRLEAALDEVDVLLGAQEDEVDQRADGAVDAADDAYDAQVDSVQQSVATAARTASEAQGEAQARMLAMADHFELGMQGEAALFQEGSTSFFAQAGWELGEGEPERVRTIFAQVVHGPAPEGGTTLEESFASQALDFREDFRDQVADIEQVFRRDKAFDPIIDAAAEELHQRATRYESAANGGFMGGSGTDEDGMYQALMGLTRKGMAGLDWVYDDEHGSSLEAEARDEMSGGDLRIALDLIAGNNAAAAVQIAQSSTGWFGVSRETREMAIRSLSPEERAQMVADPNWEAAAAAVAELPETEAGITQALVEGDTARAFALHLDESLERKRRVADEDGVQDVINGMEREAAEWIAGPYRAGRVPPERARELTVDAFREHAESRGVEGAAGLTDAEAAEQFATHATRTMRAWVDRGDGHYQQVDREMSATGAAAVRDTVIHGAGSPESRATRLIYEQERARTVGVTETRTERIAEVAEDPALAAARHRYAQAEASGNPNAIRDARTALDQAEARHRQFLVRYGEQTGADPATMADPVALEDHVAARVGDTFAGEHRMGRRFGESMIRTGRMDLLAATMLATDGAGTHENLLRRAFADRRPEEFEQLRETYRDETDEDLDDVLFNDTLSELSGDDAIEFRDLMRGQPTNDLQRMRNLYARAGDEIAGTGIDGRAYVEGTHEGQYLLRQRRDARDSILDTLDAQGVPPEQRWAFDAEGNPNPLAFGEDGTFLGDRTAFLLNTGDLRRGAEVWRAEIAQAESLLTSIIQAVGAIVGVLLMFVPGVNMVVAGIVTALVIGAATMAVKYGMRGSRYGWEEAAVDVGTTAVDAATAGLGGIGQSARVAGAAAARTGSALARSVGREAFSGFVGAAANTAMQDQIWADGFGRGLGRVLGSGVRGGLVGAVTAGVSDGLSNKLDAALGPRVVGQVTEQSVRGMSQGSRRALSEALSEAAGSVAGESTGTAFDALSGQKIDLGQALGNIAYAGVRDLVTGGLRGRVMSHQQRRLRDESHRILASGEAPTPDQLRSLHRLAITTGASGWGRRSFAEFAADFHSRRQVLASLPPGVRADFADLPLHGLVQVREMLRTGDVGSLPQRRALAHMLAESGLRDRSVEDVTLDLQRALRASADQATATRRVRRELLSDAPVPLRRALGSAPPHLLAHLDGLDGATLREIGARLGRGEPIDGPLLDRVLAEARRLDPTVDGDAVRATLGGLSDVARAVTTPQLTGEAPAAVRDAFADLPRDLQRRVRDLLDAAVPPSAAEREALRTALGDRADAVIAALPRGHARAGTLEALGDLPPGLRRAVAGLPEDAVHALRMLQARGEASPHDKAMLLARALEADPTLDAAAFLRTVDRVVTEHAGAVRVPAAVAREHRADFVSGLPPALRGLFGDVPIVVVRSEVFEAATRNPDADAVTIVVDGQPRVLLREGARDPRLALREEGVHVLQLSDPRWSEHLGSVSEGVASWWHELSLGERIAAHRRQVDLEIDAQQQLIAGLLTARQLTAADARLRGLLDRRAALEGLGLAAQVAMRAGLRAEPPLLRQPARLFNEDGAARVTVAEQVKAALDAIPDADVRATVAAWAGGFPTLTANAARGRRDDLAAVTGSPQALGVLLADLARAPRPDDGEALQRAAKVARSDGMQRAYDAAAAIPALRPLLAEGSDSPLLRLTPEQLRDHTAPLAALLGPSAPAEVRATLRQLVADGHFAALAPHLAALAAAPTGVVQALRGLLSPTRAEMPGPVLLRGPVPDPEADRRLAEALSHLPEELRAHYAQHEEAIGTIARELSHDPALLERFLAQDRSFEGLPLADTHVHATSLVSFAEMARAMDTLMAGPPSAQEAARRAAALLLEGRGVSAEARQALIESLDRIAAATGDAREVMVRRLSRQLVEVTGLPLQASQAEALASLFFSLYAVHKPIVLSRRELRDRIRTSAEAMERRGVRLIELRGTDNQLLALLPLLPPNVIGTWISQPRGQGSLVPPQLDKRLHEVRILGIDANGQEIVLTSPANWAGPFLTVASHNRGVWSQVDAAVLERLAAHLPAEVEALGRLQGVVDDLGAHEALRDRVPRPFDPRQPAAVLALADALLRDRPTGDPQADLQAAGFVNRLLLGLREGLEGLAATGDPTLAHARSLLPHPGEVGAAMLGTTMHAGEQVNSPGSVRLERLIQDLTFALDAGVDRIGHGVILMLPFTVPAGGGSGALPNAALLRRLGFVEVDGRWVRPESAPTESFDADRLRELESQRVALAQRMVRQGVTLEVNPTSNQVLSNLPHDQHPLGGLLSVIRPPPAARISINTDNPGMHVIDVRTEMALLLAHGTIAPAQAAVFALEGFSSRAGGRPLDRAEALSAETLAWIQRSFEGSGSRAALLEAMRARWPDVLPTAPDASDPAAFAEAVRAVLRRVYQIPAERDR
jgi:hypothetical protein